MVGKKFRQNFEEKIFEKMKIRNRVRVGYHLTGIGAMHGRRGYA